MCQYAAFPDVKWFSTSDVSVPALGLTCERVQGARDRAPGSSIARLLNLLRKLEELGIP